MSRIKLLADKTITALAPTKDELDKLRALAARSLSDVTASGLPTDMQFILAYDTAPTLLIARFHRSAVFLKCVH